MESGTLGARDLYEGDARQRNKNQARCGGWAELGAGSGCEVVESEEDIGSIFFHRPSHVHGHMGCLFKKISGGEKGDLCRK